MLSLFASVATKIPCALSYLCHLSPRLLDVLALLSSDQWFVVVGSECVSFGFFLFDQIYECAANYIDMG